MVEAAIDQRRQFFEAKRDHLYQVEIFYACCWKEPRSKNGVGAAIARLFRDPAGAVGELRAQFTNNSMKSLLRSQIEHDLARLGQRVQAFTRQLADFVQIELLDAGRAVPILPPPTQLRRTGGLRAIHSARSFSTIRSSIPTSRRSAIICELATMLFVC